MQKLPTQPYKGTRDFLPEEMSVRTQMFEALFRAVELFGFRRYDGPILEPATIYEAKSGEEIANQQLYRLTDKGGREIALRPEMTPSVARMIAANAETIPFPARWYSHVNCHRYERPQRGRVREHWQLNVDIFGSESIEAEVEIFNLVAFLMSALGATPEVYMIRVNDRILVDAALRNFLGVTQEQLIPTGMAIDRWDKVEPGKRAEELQAIGLSTDQIDRLNRLTQMDLEEFCQAAGPDAAERSRVAHIIREGLSDAPLKFDPLIMRAFNYYTATVFEVFDVSPTNRRSIFGGGRYDDLASLFTTKRIPGVGFGMGDVTTWNFLEQHQLLPKPNLGPDVYLFVTNPEFRPLMRQTVKELRKRGIRSEPAFEAKGLRAGLKTASHLGTKFSVIFADDELKSGNALVKDMIISTQTALPVSDVAEFIARRFHESDRKKCAEINGG